MVIILNNHKFDYDLALRMLKTKYTNYQDCHIKDQNIEDCWDDINPLTFKDIASLRNMEERRTGFMYYGIDRLVAEVNPKLINKETLVKKNKWLNPETLKEEVKEIHDTYELYEISGTHLGDTPGLWSSSDIRDQHFVKCSCTSTGRVYHIWIDRRAVSLMKLVGDSNHQYRTDTTPIDAIDAIAWTFTTNVKEEAVEYWLRQGDAIFCKIKPEWEKQDYTIATTEGIQDRHLTAKEYKEKLVYES